MRSVYQALFSPPTRESLGDEANVSPFSGLSASIWCIVLLAYARELNLAHY